MTGQALLQLAMALFASLGFALMFNLRAKLLAPAALGGLLSWAVYLFCGTFLEGVFVPCLVASVFAVLYAQLLAHVNRAPIGIFYILACIPLIPGAGLYNTMSSVVAGNWDAAGTYGLTTVQFVLAIAFGIGIAWAVREIARRWLAARAARRGA